MNDSVATPAQEAGWLLLIHQIPPKPDYFRVKVRRRLRHIGARALKNSVYILPKHDEALEDFQWLARDITAEGGEAMVCEAQFIQGITTQELEAMFHGPEETSRHEAAAPTRAEEVRGRTWVTRQGVKVDRMASAWLIRRFIDPEARFKLVAPRGYRPEAGELRFDMYEAEYTHEGDRCTFETLLHRFRLKGGGLKQIAEIVHDVDCKDAKFERDEAAGVAAMVDGIARANTDDAARLEQGAALFETLYSGFQKA